MVTNSVRPLLLSSSNDGIARASQLLRDGELVAFPTETVYGLGARADVPAAVAQVYAAKGRPAVNPLIVHVPDLAVAQNLASFDDDAMRLAEAFWPGPLTLVLPKRPDSEIVPAATAGLPSVALRSPDHPVALALLRATGLPIVAPSANLSGRLSPTTAKHVLSGLGARIAAIVDGGGAEIGVESSIVATGKAPRLLRPGGLPLGAIEACLGTDLAIDAGSDHAPEAPGQLASHYAPRAILRLNATASAADEVHLGFGSVPGDLSLSQSGDLAEAARRLFAALAELDARGPSKIAVAPIPDQGLGRAINDRLRRAAAPRDQRHG
ncbi:MAG: L-threonylcarbamoyladenylate synthase [Pseudomonadota bacterium]